MRSWVKVIMESVSIALLAIVLTVMCYDMLWDCGAFKKVSGCAKSFL